MTSPGPVPVLFYQTSATTSSSQSFNPAQNSSYNKWYQVDMGIVPQNMAWQLIFTSNSVCTVNLEVTVDNPYIWGSSLAGTGGMATWPSTQQPYPLVLATFTASNTGQFAPVFFSIMDGQISNYSTGSSAGVVLLTSQFSGPIYAWRANVTSGTVNGASAPTCITFLQAGKKQ